MIADNFGFHDDAIERTADHLQRFWAPSMRQKLLDYHAGGGEGLQWAVQEALQRPAGA
jgi:hypothetical protein